MGGPLSHYFLPLKNVIHIHLNLLNLTCFLSLFKPHLISVWTLLSLAISSCILHILNLRGACMCCCLKKQWFCINICEQHPSGHVKQWSLLESIPCVFWCDKNSDLISRTARSCNQIQLIIFSVIKFLSNLHFWNYYHSACFFRQCCKKPFVFMLSLFQSWLEFENVDFLFLLQTNRHYFHGQLVFACPVQYHKPA